MQKKNKFLKPKTHKNFKINGKSYDANSLLIKSDEFINEGKLFEKEIGVFLKEWIDDKEYVIVSTSGSTGKPKKIKIHKQNMVNSAVATGDYLMIKKKTRALLCLSANHIAGKMMLVRAMTLGWEIDLINPSTTPLDSILKKYDFCAMIPLQLSNSLKKAHLIKKIIVGGGVISDNLKEQLVKIKTKVYETYGMTETVSHIALKRINSRKKYKKNINLFKALPNINLSIDERNCLIINAPQLSDELIVTNDIVDLVTRKKFVWKGRYDNVINSGGIKLYPEEIEDKLKSLIPYRYFISSIPDNATGNKLILIIEQILDSETSILHKKIADLQTLSKYEIPKEIFFVPYFIETENGKIQRTKTLELALGIGT